MDTLEDSKDSERALLLRDIVSQRNTSLQALHTLQVVPRSPWWMFVSDVRWWLLKVGH